MDDRRRDVAKIVMEIDPSKNPTMHPRSHFGLYSFMLELRQDLYRSNVVLKKRRKQAIKALYEEDMRRDDEEMRMIGRAFMLDEL